MAEVLPPSPNWYLNSILDCSPNGILAYGSKNLIVLANFNPKDGKLTPDISLINHAHKERVTVVAFSNDLDSNGNAQYLASAGDDCLVKVWDLNTLSTLFTTRASEKVVCIDWLKKSSRAIVFADVNNNIVCWHIFSNSIQTFNFGKLFPSTLKCCPHNEDLLAIGTRNGLVCILSLRNSGKILYRLRFHSLDVVSLSWCPVNYNIFSNDKCKNEMLLASGSKDKDICIWRAGTDGRYEVILNLPSSSLSVNPKQKHTNTGSNSNIWISLYWVEPNLLLSSSLLGELIAWDLNAVAENMKNKDEKQFIKPFTLLHSGHSKMIFCIGCSNYNRGTDYQTAETKRNSLGLVWTTSLDRLLIAFDLQSKKSAAVIPTIGGFVYCMSLCPVGSTRLAIGVGDAMIRVWNLSKTDLLDVTTFWQKIQGKVTSLAWHPTKENILAYGTAEGRIGIFDVTSNKAPSLFRLFHRQSVYTLNWGHKFSSAAKSSVNLEYLLYSCADGEIVMYDPERIDETPLNIEDMFGSGEKKRKRTDFAWKSDYSLLAIGNEDGSVQIFSENFVLKQTLFPHKKLIQCLAWHPESTATDVSYSCCCNWLAVTSNDTSIKIYDLSNLTNEREGDDIISTVASLNGHSSRVVNVAWSPHISGQLVSTSYDETVQIWDVLRQQPVANFNKHSGLVLCAIWSPLDPDIIISGSADFTLRMWKISAQTDKKPVNKKEKKIEQKKLLNFSRDQQSAIHNNCKSESNSQFLKNELTEKENALSLKGNLKKKQVGKSYFPQYSAEKNQGKEKNIMQCFNLLKELTGVTNCGGLGFFGDRDEIVKLLDKEKEYHLKNENLDYAYNIGLWEGNLQDMLKEAATKDQLNDWLVSLAPMVSLKLWREMCQLYSKQLEAAGNIQKAASYLLACHKIEDALELLTSHKLYKEALAIAKCRLPPSDPTIEKIVKEWSKNVTFHGNYEAAAECLMYLGDYEEAAKLFAKRKDGLSLELAAALAKQSGEHEFMHKLALQSAEQYLNECKWENAQNVAINNGISYFVPVIVAHEILIKCFSNFLENSDSDQTECLIHWFTGGNKDIRDLPTLFYKSWERKKPTDIDETVVYKMLCKSPEEMPMCDTPDILWLNLSKEIVLFCFSESESQKLLHLVKTNLLCYKFISNHSFNSRCVVFISLLFPAGPSGTTILQNLPETSDNPLQKSLRAFFSAIIVVWLEKLLSEWIDSLEAKFDKHTLLWTYTSNFIVNFLDDLLDKEGMLLSHLELQIKKYEQKIAASVAKSQYSCESCVGEENEVFQGRVDLELDTTKLCVLKEQHRCLKEKRLDFPNPPFVFYKVKNICDIICRIESAVGNNLLSKVNDHWECITNGML